jgi:hypothetical protein
MTTTQSGLLLIADITGYTLFLSEAELEHAQEILTVLLEGIITHTRPPLTISRTAGDAIISYALGESALQGQTFVELLEDTYLAFRRTVELMVLNNKCQCTACTMIPDLDLKFFVHYGRFGLQMLGGHTEMVGSDVNLIHRLLKNHITEQTGIRAYVVYSAAAVDALGLAEMAAAMIPHQETYDYVGTVDLFVQDIRPIWDVRRHTTDVDIAEGDVLVTVNRDFPLPPHLMWDALSRPEYRAPLLGALNQKISKRQKGRIVPGTEIHCDHGDRVTVQRILTWRPFEMMLSEDTTPVPGATCYVRFTLTPAEAGTNLEVAVSKGRGPVIQRNLMNTVAQRTLPGVLSAGLEQLAAQLEASDAPD